MPPRPVRRGQPFQPGPVRAPFAGTSQAAIPAPKSAPREPGSAAARRPAPPCGRTGGLSPRPLDPRTPSATAAPVTASGRTGVRADRADRHPVAGPEQRALPLRPGIIQDRHLPVRRRPIGPDLRPKSKHRRLGSGRRGPRGNHRVDECPERLGHPGSSPRPAGRPRLPLGLAELQAITVFEIQLLNILCRH